MPSASLSRRSLTSRRRSRPTASSRPLSPSTWPRSRSPHETPHGSGRVAFREEFHAGSLRDRKSTRLNSSHVSISYAVFCLKKKKKDHVSLASIIVDADSEH